MSVTITVDLGTSSPKDIARAAKFMLEFAGYQDPSVGQTERDSWVGSQSFPEASAPVAGALITPRGSLGEEIADDNGPLPTTAFGAGTHGSPELDADAAKLTAMGADAGPTIQMYPEQPAGVTTAAATLPPPPPGIEVDAQGVPWDQRIHAGSRAKIADGTWRQRRNLDPEVFKRVMDELRATMGVERRAPQPPAPPTPAAVFAPHPPVPPVPPVPPAPVVEPDIPLVAPPAPDAFLAPEPEVPPAPFAANVAPLAPPISSTPPVPASAGAAPAASLGSGPVTFPALMKQITARIANKSLTGEQVNEAARAVGLPSFPMLASRADLVADVATKLGIAL